MPSLIGNKPNQVPTNGDLGRLAFLDQLPTSLLAFNTGSLGLRNRFINGRMIVDQRNAGASQTITAGAALAYTVDRWYGYCTGANVTGQRVAGTAPNDFNYRFTGAASVTKIGFAQRIEAANCQDLAGTTATLSVDLANSLLTTVTWTAWYANTANTFGTLASPTRTQIATGTFTVTSTLTRYNAQIVIPAAATTGIEIEFSVDAQTSGTWTIGRAQFESGAVPTPFEFMPFGENLILCQRYFCKTFAYGTAPAQNVGIDTGEFNFTVIGASIASGGRWQFPVTMRATPGTITTFNPAAANAQIRNRGTSTDFTGTATINSSDSGVYVSGTTPAGSSAGNAASVHITASAEL